MVARPLRIEYEGAFYHVTVRGNERKEIFFAGQDYSRFKEYLRETRDKYHFLLHCYVLMTNHYHLLIETPEGNISQLMHRLNTSYTGYINRTRQRIGHLFQGRYKAILVDRDNYLLELSRYMHLNPVRAGMASSPEDYPHSSYHSYVSHKKDELVSKDLILSMISPDSGRAPLRYRDFVLSASCPDTESPLRNALGNLILGGRDFAKQALGRVEEKTLEHGGFAHSRELRSAWKTDAVVNALCEGLGLSRKTFPANLAENRDIAIFILKQHTGMTNGQVAEILGVTTSSAVAKAYQRLRSKLVIETSLLARIEAITSLLSNVKT